MTSISFLSLSADKEEKCLICDKEFTKREKLSSFTPAGWDAFKAQAQKWTLIEFLGRCEECAYRFVYSEVRYSTSPNGAIHPICKSAFTLRYERTLLKYGEKRNAPETSNN